MNRFQNYAKLTRKTTNGAQMLPILAETEHTPIPTFLYSDKYKFR